MTLLDPDPYIVKVLDPDPDPYIEYTDPQHCFLDTILTVLDPNPYSQYGSGSRGAVSTWIHMDPDLDPKHWIAVMD